MRVLLVGDLHGQIGRFAASLAAWCKPLRLDACCQVGDFGFHRRQWGRFTGTLAVPVHAVCGNHEDHGWLRRCERHGLVDDWRQRNLHYQARGSVVDLDGATVGFIGGALNIDCRQRGSRRRHTTNYLLEDEADRALAAFTAQPPSLIVSHSCPAGIGLGMRGNPALAAEVLRFVTWAGYDAGPEGDCGERQLERLWHGLTARPPLWIFGHFHQYRTTAVDDTRFLCLPNIETPEPLVVWDTRSGTVELLAVP